jgi:glycosyltransferase involved in cell wall biosynthesis
VGGVESVLLARLEGLGTWGIEAEAWFLFDGPGRELFHDVADQIHIGSTEALEEYLSEESFQFVSVIDTEEIFTLLTRMDEPIRTLLEVHTPYPEILTYLNRLGDVPHEAILVPSRHQAKVVKSYIPNALRILVVPNSLGKHFAASIESFSPAPPRPIIAWLGRLDDLKNWREYIQICSAVHKINPQVEFWIVGKGDEVSEDIYTAAGEAQILQRLRWYRGVNYLTVPSLLNAVRASGGLVISTSLGDSFGMTIAEAMARACAVVVPSEGPFREFVEERVHGVHYTLGNPIEAAEKILALFRDTALRTLYGSQARESILERYSPEVALEVLARGLRDLL